MKNKKKLKVLSCKCERGVYGESSVLNNCKCKSPGRKERQYDSVIIEDSKK